MVVALNFKTSDHNHDSLSPHQSAKNEQVCTKMCSNRVTRVSAGAFRKMENLLQANPD